MAVLTSPGASVSRTVILPLVAFSVAAAHPTAVPATPTAARRPKDMRRARRETEERRSTWYSWKSSGSSVGLASISARGSLEALRHRLSPALPCRGPGGTRPSLASADSVVGRLPHPASHALVPGVRALRFLVCAGSQVGPLPSRFAT